MREHAQRTLSSAHPGRMRPVCPPRPAALSCMAMVTAAYVLGLNGHENPVDVEIFADQIDAKVAARVFNLAYLSGARSAVVEPDPRGWVVRVYQYAPVRYLAANRGAA